MARQTVAVLAAVLAQSWAIPGRAAPPAEVDVLINRGLDLRQQGDPKSALATFQRAHELAPSPRTLTQMGWAEQALGHWTDAEAHLDTALAARSDAWIKPLRKVIGESLAKVKAHVGRVEVMGDPVGAEVRMNGRVVGTLPLGKPVRVNEGPVDVELTAAGHRRGQRTLAVRGGELQTVTLRLDKEPAASIAASTRPAPVVAAPRSAPALAHVPAPVAASTPAAAAPPPVSSAPSVALRSPPPAVDAPPTDWRRWAKWVSVAATGATMGLGIYGAAAYQHKIGQFNNDGCGVDGTTHEVVDAVGEPSPGCEILRTDYTNAKRLAIVGFASAGALAATSLILFLTEPDAPAPGRVAWGCAPRTPMPGAPLGLDCRLRF